MITISKAKIQDNFAIIDLEKKIRNEKYVGNVYENSAFINYWFVFVAKDQTKLIGAIVSFIGKNDTIYVTDIVVDPRYRGQHIWKMLYQKVIHEAKKIKKDIHALVWPEYIESNNLHKKLWFKLTKKIKEPYGKENKNNLMYLYKLKVI